MVIDKFLKGEEVARILRVSRAFAYQLMREGVIPSIRLGRAIRVREIDLQNFIEKNIKSEHSHHEPIFERNK